MSEKRPRVLGIGELLWDMLPAGRQLGGAPANFAYHCARQGCDAAIVSSVGDDELGRDAIAQLRAKGVDAHLIATVPDLPTGQVDVVLDADGQPEYDIRRNVAWDRLPWNEYLFSELYGYDAMCYGTLAGRTPENINTLDKILTLGYHAMLVFDVNLRPPHVERDAIMAGLMRATVVKLNSVEAKYLASMLGLGEDNPRRLFDALTTHASRLTTLIITDGAAGSRVIDRDEGESYVASPTVAVVDTVGAGDAFTATFVTARLKGDSIEEAHQRAAHVAAAVCSEPGAMPDIY